MSIAAAKAILPIFGGCQTKRDAMIGLGSNDDFLSSTPHTVTLRTREGWAFLTSVAGNLGYNGMSPHATLLSLNTGLHGRLFLMVQHLQGQN